MDNEFLQRLRAAIAALETIGADWSLFDSLPEEDRERLHKAVAVDPQPRPHRAPQAAEGGEEGAAARRDPARGGGAARHRHPRRCAASRCSPRRTSFPPKASSPATADDAATCARRSSRSTATSASRSTRSIHHFYDQLCPACAEFNFAKRTELADLRGRVALLTGGRVKIGYQAGLKLLRCGARLIVTTRFPRDSAQRYAQEPDFDEWARSARDLRPRPAPHAERRGVLPQLLATRERLDFIVNNACQTVRRPPDFYAAHDGRARRRLRMLGTARLAVPKARVDVCRWPAKRRSDRDGG